MAELPELNYDAEKSDIGGRAEDAAEMECWCLGESESDSATEAHGAASTFIRTRT